MALEKFRSKLVELQVSERLVGCIAKIYENTTSDNDDGMRAAVVDICVQYVDQLLSRKAFLSLIHHGGDFAVDLMRALAVPGRYDMAQIETKNVVGIGRTEWSV